VDSSVIVNIALLVVTMIGVVIAFLQAREARAARDDARTASAEAYRHEQRTLRAAENAAQSAQDSADAHRRIAEASEARLELERASRSPSESWTFRPLGDGNSDQRWMVTNNSDETALWVTLATPNGFNERWIQPESNELETVAPGESVYFTFIRRLSSPSTAVVWVLWSPSDGSAQKQLAKTIDAYGRSEPRG
jgi:hypothetical protein